MAVAELIVSRRALLAAACAAPAALAAPLRRQGPSPSSLHPGEGRGPDDFRDGNWIPDQVRKTAQSPTVTKWDRALARFRRAEAALAAAAHEPDEDRYGDLVVAFNRALERLLRAPAPDLHALALKIDLTIDQSAWELTDGETCMAALARDANRLCG